MITEGSLLASNLRRMHRDAVENEEDARRSVTALSTAIRGLSETKAAMVSDENRAKTVSTLNSAHTQVGSSIVALIMVAMRGNGKGGDAGGARRAVENLLTNGSGLVGQLVREGPKALLQNIASAWRPAENTPERLLQTQLATGAKAQAGAFDTLAGSRQKERAHVDRLVASLESARRRALRRADDAVQERRELERVMLA